MWPEFNDSDFDAALAEFAHRERRFGAVPEPLAAPKQAQKPVHDFRMNA
jgi:hypothetical protein